MWKFKSICCVCGRETPACDDIMELGYMKEKCGFTRVEVYTGWSRGIKLRSINFCPSCASKSYTIEELKTIGNYNCWSY
jgi:hypothetical protein